MDTTELIDRYCAAWTDPDAARRAAILGEVWASAATYTDPSVPEAISSTSGLLASGFLVRRIFGMWALIAVVSGLASLAGYVAFRHASGDVVAFVLAFAGGAILTMLADTMMPEAYKHGGKLVGVVTTLGFVLALLIDQLD